MFNAASPARLGMVAVGAGGLAPMLESLPNTPVRLQVSLILLIRPSAVELGERAAATIRKAVIQPTER